MGPQYRLTARLRMPMKPQGSWLALHKPPGKSVSRQEYDLFFVIDLEETCMNYEAIDPQEVIEFSAIAISAATGQIQSEFHIFVKPEINPRLTEYCIETTGITQENVDSGVEFTKCMDLVDEWLDSLKCNSGEVSYTWVSLNDRDLGTLLPAQFELHKCSLPMAFQQWVNVKEVFFAAYKVKPTGLMSMLDELSLELTGLQHGGIDACRNVGKIVTRMIWDNVQLKNTSGQ